MENSSGSVGRTYADDTSRGSPAVFVVSLSLLLAMFDFTVSHRRGTGRRMALCGSLLAFRSTSSSGRQGRERKMCPKFRQRQSCKLFPSRNTQQPPPFWRFMHCFCRIPRLCSPSDKLSPPPSKWRNWLWQCSLSFMCFSFAHEVFLFRVHDDDNGAFLERAHSFSLYLRGVASKLWEQQPELWFTPHTQRKKKGLVGRLVRLSCQCCCYCSCVLITVVFTFCLFLKFAKPTHLIVASLQF